MLTVSLEIIYQILESENPSISAVLLRTIIEETPDFHQDHSSSLSVFQQRALFYAAKLIESKVGDLDITNCYQLINNAPEKYTQQLLGTCINPSSNNIYKLIDLLLSNSDARQKVIFLNLYKDKDYVKEYLCENQELIIDLILKAIAANLNELITNIDAVLETIDIDNNRIVNRLNSYPLNDIKTFLNIYHHTDFLKLFLLKTHDFDAVVWHAKQSKNLENAFKNIIQDADNNLDLVFKILHSAFRSGNAEILFQYFNNRTLQQLFNLQLSSLYQILAVALNADPEYFDNILSLGVEENRILNYISTPDDNGKTLLHHLVNYPTIKKESLQHLLNKYSTNREQQLAFVMLKDSSGQMPIEYASKAGSDYVFELLPFYTYQQQLELCEKSLYFTGESWFVDDALKRILKNIAYTAAINLLQNCGLDELAKDLENAQSYMKFIDDKLLENRNKLKEEISSIENYQDFQKSIQIDAIDLIRQVSNSYLEFDKKSGRTHVNVCGALVDAANLSADVSNIDLQKKCVNRSKELSKSSIGGKTARVLLHFAEGCAIAGVVLFFMFGVSHIHYFFPAVVASFFVLVAALAMVSICDSAVQVITNKPGVKTKSIVDPLIVKIKDATKTSADYVKHAVSNPKTTLRDLYTKMQASEKELKAEFLVTNSRQAKKGNFRRGK